MLIELNYSHVYIRGPEFYKSIPHALFRTRVLQYLYGGKERKRGAE